MKKLLFFLFILILQIYGVTNLFGNTFKAKSSFVSHNNSIKNNKATYSDNDQNIFLLEESDIDFEEEFHNDDINNLVKIHFLENQNYFIKSIQNFNSKLFVLNFHTYSFSIFSSFFGSSNPIYISNRVLRI